MNERRVHLSGEPIRSPEPSRLADQEAELAALAVELLRSVMLVGLPGGWASVIGSLEPGLASRARDAWERIRGIRR